MQCRLPSFWKNGRLLRSTASAQLRERRLPLLSTSFTLWRHAVTVGMTIVCELPSLLSRLRAACVIGRSALSPAWPVSESSRERDETQGTRGDAKPSLTRPVRSCQPHPVDLNTHGLTQMQRLPETPVDRRSHLLKHQMAALGFLAGLPRFRASPSGRRCPHSRPFPARS